MNEPDGRTTDGAVDPLYGAMALPAARRGLPLWARVAIAATGLALLAWIVVLQSF